MSDERCADCGYMRNERCTCRCGKLKAEPTFAPMNAKLIISNTEIALDFDGQDDRDLFYDNLAGNRSCGFAPQDAAEKIGARTIRFDQSRFSLAYVWKISFPR
jgi:hypothetical protein